jgi:hypothetical protein
MVIHGECLFFAIMLPNNATKHGQEKEFTEETQLQRAI